MAALVATGGSGGSRGRARTIVVSALLALHLGCLVWWNVLKVGLPQPETPRGRAVVGGYDAVRDAVVETVDPTGSVGRFVRAYMRGTATWQQWWLFSPNAPEQGAALVLHGITAVGPQGVAVDPVPFYEASTGTLEDHVMAIGKPPCGWPLVDDPRSLYMRQAYARYRLREHHDAGGEPYLGVRMVCYVYELPAPGDHTPRAEIPIESWVLWEGSP